MPGRFDGQVVLVTGAASGVGARAVEILVEEGARVVTADIDRAPLESRARELGRAVTAVLADVSRSDECEALVQTSLQSFGRLDAVFANAGVTLRAPLDETTDAVWQHVLDANLASVFRIARAAAPLLCAIGGGAIVVNASINSIRGNVDLVAYSAAKAGALGIVRALAIELADTNIRVNAVCPGTIATPMTESYIGALPPAEAAEVTAAMIAKHPLGRFGSADDVARAALFLASHEASFITGVALPVDGGRHIR